MARRTPTSVPALPQHLPRPYELIKLSKTPGAVILSAAKNLLPHLFLCLHVDSSLRSE